MADVNDPARSNNLKLYRGADCHLCGGHYVRRQQPTHEPGGAVFNVAVCPVCDVADLSHPA